MLPWSVPSTASARAVKRAVYGDAMSKVMNDERGRPSDWAQRILRVLDHVHENLDSDLDPGALADLAGFSRHHFHRVFRGMVGESVMGHVRRLRLERAAFRLRHGAEDVTTVALSFGYGSHEAFTRAFRAHFGVPPSTFRDATRASESEGTRISAELHERSEQIILVRTFVGPYEACGAAWGELMAFAGRAALLPPSAPTVGLVYDDPEITAPEACRYDAGLPISPGRARELALPPGFAVRRVPAGRFAVTLHRGPYATILDTYVGLLGRWLPRQGLDLADEPVVETYLDAPGSVPESDLRTEVAVRLS